MNIPSNFDWKLYSWLKRGPRRRAVLKHLAKVSQPVTATDVKRVQKVDITQAAYTLTELREKRLVKCLNPDDHHGKLYVIANKGKEMLKYLSR